MSRWFIGEKGREPMVNVVLLLVMLGVGLIVVMCLDFQWLHTPTRRARRQPARHARMGLGKP